MIQSSEPTPRRNFFYRFFSPALTIREKLKTTWDGWIDRIIQSDRTVYYRRWLVLSIVCVILLVVVEIISHSTMTHDRGYPYWIFPVILTLVLLITSLVFQVLLFRLIGKKKLEIDNLNYRNGLSLKLAITQDRDEVVKQLLQYNHNIAPLSAEALLIYNRESGEFEPIAQWKSNTSESTLSSLTQTSEFCKTCGLHQSARTRSLESCQSLSLTGCLRQETCPNFNPEWCASKNEDCVIQPVPGTQLYKDYCLPIFYDSNPVALVRFRLPPGISLSPEQINALDNTAPVVSATLEGARLQQERLDNALSKATHAERRSIARDLHDTLVQDLCYMRLKLEQLAGDMRSDRTEDVLGDLVQLQEVVNGDYEAVRGTLASLYSENAAMLEKLLSDHADLVSDRSDLDINFSIKGIPRAFTPEAIRQIFYVYREATHNIEKHARASKVSIETFWGEQDLNICIADNGVGFDPERVNRGTHFGLSMMQERIETAGGEIAIKSSSDGTQVQIRIPYDKALAQPGRASSTSKIHH